MNNMKTLKFNTIVVACIITLLFSINLYSYEISTDAIILTLRSQKQISLDSILATKVDSSLIAARNTNDAIVGIHAFPEYVLNMMILKTEATWSNAWKEGNILTGDTYIDSLGMLYGLDSVIYQNHSLPNFILYFSEPLKISSLSELYERHEEIIWAEPNFCVGDGNNIEMVQLEDSLHLAFSIGTGDCPAGCIYRYYWYISVYKANGSYTGILQEERERDFSIPFIYRWNIPARYAITMFSSINLILTTIKESKIWWIKRHCIESLWRLYVNDSPWVVEDYNNHSVWNSLKSEIDSKHNEIISTITYAINDSVQYVSESAIFALSKINSMTIIEDNFLPVSEILVRTYPNPFNSSVTFEISVPLHQMVDINIYNILGERVEALFSKVMVSETFKFVWNASKYAGGVYIYEVVSKNFRKTGKVLFIK